MLKMFIEEVCDILEISVPKISYDTSKFPTETMMAQCDIKGNKIYIKKYDKPNLDQLFSVAHELRHLWQYTTNKNKYLSDYKRVFECQSVKEYNLQLAEIDANAFASMITFVFFGATAQFNGVPDEVKNVIYKHERTLRSQYYYLFMD